MLPHRNNEESLGDTIGDALTGGWYTTGKGLSLVLVKLFCANIFSLLHRRFGSHFITVSTIWWNILLTGIFWLAANSTGRVLFKWHILLMAAASLWHVYESNRNLRRPLGQRRHSLFIGESLLWVPFARLVYLLKLDGLLANMTENGFQKYVESLLCIVVGLVLSSLGLFANGFFFMLCGASIFRLHLNIERHDRLNRQKIWDAEHGSGAIEEAQAPPRPSNKVRGKATRRRGGAVPQ